MAFTIHVVLCLMCVMIPALLAAHVTIDDTQQNANADIISVLVKQVQDLKAVVKAQGQAANRLETVVKEQGLELHELKAEVKAKTEKLQFQSETIHNLKTIVQAQSEEVMALKNSVQEQRELGLEKFEGEHQQSKLEEDKLENQGSSGQLSRGIREAEGVAFTAYQNHELIDISLHHVIKPEKTLLNDGNAYNIHTGVFTVPSTGVYFFIYFIDDARVGEMAGIRLVVDDVHEVDAYVHPNNGHGVMGGNSAILRVNAGQAVWLESFYNDDADLVSRDGFRAVTFSGFRIY